MIYFSADLHFFHKNIISYCNRPFVSVDEMNQKILSNFSERINHDDTLILAGDISFGNEEETYYMISHLPGNKILVYGNHDDVILKSSKISSLFQRIVGLYEFNDSSTKQKFVVCHYPMMSWNRSHKGSYMVHGHEHANIKKYPFDGRIMDVGVDCNDFYPYSTLDVVNKLKNAKYGIHH